MRIWRKIKRWLWLRPRPKFVGAPCPHGWPDYRPLCRFVQGRQGLSTDSLDRVAECIGLRVVIEDNPRQKKG